MSAPRDPSLEPLIDRVLGLILEADRAPHPDLPRRLTALFRRLAAARTAEDAERAQDLVWAVWCDHDDKALAEAMHDGIAAMAAEDFETAGAIFDALVAAAPGWPEAYNKRATVRFVEERDAQSLADIAEVLAREPRHFGALSGFGQIALRNGFVHEAAVGFERAVAVNPHLRGVASLLADLRRERTRSLN